MSDQTTVTEQHNYYDKDANFLSGFKMHMWLAFREFDIMYMETYIFTVIIGFSIIWGIFTVI